jgi:signal transduction histidine kinase
VKERRQQSAVREAVIRFVASSVILLLILMVGTLFLAGQIARQEALREARSRGSAIGNLIAGPLVNAEVRAHVPGASVELTTVMRNRMRDGSVVHVKLWTKDGEVIWSDEKKLVGRQFPLVGDVKALFGTDKAIAEVSNLSKSENEGERNLGELLEVYVGVHDADQTPLVFEAYFSTETMRQDEQAIYRGYLPVIFAALLLFQVAVLPMALSLARRVERGLVERSKLMRHALLASDLERRRISQELHDGVIQDLAGVCYAMPTLEAHFADDFANRAARERARETAREISQVLMRDVATLRGMITAVYPPDLDGPGFSHAVTELARIAGEHGVQVQVNMPPDLTAPPDAARLAYRVVREGLRNSVKHAQATDAMVEVRQESGLMVVLVSDNGRGIDDAQAPMGHVGLRLLADTVRDFDGRMTLRSSPSGGAVLEASFPVRLARP